MIALWMLTGCGVPGLQADKAETEDTAGDPDGALACGEDVAVFEAHVWEPVMSRQCAVCHVAGGVAGQSAMVLDPDDPYKSMMATIPVMDRLLDKPSGAHPDGHGGGDIVAPGSPEHEALAFWEGWAAGVCDLPEDIEQCEPLGRRARRLSHSEYARTVFDLVGVEIDISESLAADVSVEGFSNDAEALVVASLLADQYRALAEDIAGKVDVDALLGCNPAELGATNCAHQFIEAFGTQAFRRPIKADELERYADLWRTVADEEDFDEGIRWVLTAMLQSPHFLYRSELGIQSGSGRFELTAWEQATELSYLLWGTTPDAALLEDAEDGALDLQAQVERLSADPRASEVAADVVSVWLMLDRLQGVSREGLTDPLRESMDTEVRTLVASIAQEGGTLADLLGADQTWLDAEMAEHYGASDTGWVPIDDGGLLSRAAVLTTHGLSLGSGPVQRGVAVRERLLCEPLALPPASLDTSPPPVDPAASTRDRYAQHSDDPLCAGCHELIDPIGFGFEHYDQLGRWRIDDSGHEIDASGAVDGATFDGVSGLTDVLLDDPRVRTCHVQMWRRWGTGAEACGEDYGDIALTQPLHDLVGEEDFTVRYGTSVEGDTLAAGARLVLETLPKDDIGGTSGVELVLTEVSRWSAGWCADGEVINHGADPVTWAVRSTLEGSITSIWGAVYEEDGAATVFSGVDWNASLEAGGATTFGFCGAF